MRTMQVERVNMIIVDSNGAHETIAS